MGVLECQWCGVANQPVAVECRACGAQLQPAAPPAPQSSTPPADSAPEPPEPLMAEPSPPPTSPEAAAPLAPVPPPKASTPPSPAAGGATPPEVNAPVGEFRPCANPQCLAPVWSEDPFCPACGYSQFGGGDTSPASMPEPALPPGLPEPVSPPAPLPDVPAQGDRPGSVQTTTRSPYQSIWVAMGILGSVAFCAGLVFLGWVWSVGLDELEDNWATRAAFLPAPAQSATVTRTATPSRTPTPTVTPTGTPRPATTTTTTRTPTMTPEPGWRPPADLPADAKTVAATTDKLFSGVTLYNQMGKFRLQFIGRSDNCPKYPSGKGILYREANGLPISQEESRVLDWATNPGTGYRIRADDPALQTKEWKVYPACP